LALSFVTRRLCVGLQGLSSSCYHDRENINLSTTTELFLFLKLAEGYSDFSLLKCGKGSKQLVVYGPRRPISCFTFNFTESNSRDPIDRVDGDSYERIRHDGAPEAAGGPHPRRHFKLFRTYQLFFLPPTKSFGVRSAPPSYLQKNAAPEVLTLSNIKANNLAAELTSSSSQ
jgi:hypothetical protein